MKKLNIVGFVHSPLNLLAAVAAFRTLDHGSLVRITLAICWPGVSREILKELTKVVRKILSEMPETITLIEFSDHDLAELGPTTLTSEMNCQYVDQIYYPHDISGPLYINFCCAYPDAERVCYGDALGNVYERHVHLGLISSGTDQGAITDNSSGCLRSLFRRVRNYVCSDKNPVADNVVHFPPHKAVLVLPVDQSGHFLDGVELVVCKKETIQQVIKEAAFACHELESYLSALCDLYRGRECYLLLTENHAESGLIDFRSEIDMYVEAITGCCSSGSVVFLKSHPGETLPRNAALAEALTDQFEIVELDSQFKRYPIELWYQLIYTCHIICMSYPILSLKFLYGVDVIQPMDDLFIERWFPKRAWVSYKNSVSLYREPLLRLDSWDQTSVLWAGTV
jgi:hypothetical protein